MLRLLSRLVWVVAEILLVVALTVFVLLPMPVLSRLTGVAALVDSISIMVRFVVLLIVYLVLIGLMFTQLRPPRRSKVDGLVVKASGTVADLSVESAHAQIVRAVSEIPDVESVTCEIVAQAGKAVIELDVIVMPELMDIPAKQKEIDRTLKRVVNKQMGVQLAHQPVVHIKLLPAHEPALPEPETSVEAEPSFVADVADTPPPAAIEEPVPFDTADDEPIPAMDAPVSALPLNAEVVDSESSNDNADGQTESDTDTDNEPAVAQADMEPPNGFKPGVTEVVEDSSDIEGQANTI